MQHQRMGDELLRLGIYAISDFPWLLSICSYATAIYIREEKKNDTRKTRNRKEVVEENYAVSRRQTMKNEKQEKKVDEITYFGWVKGVE